MLSISDPSVTRPNVPTPENVRFAEFGDDPRPILVNVIDTEETFDWGSPFSRESTSVDWVEGLHLVAGIKQANGVRPTYLVDYPVVEAEETSAVFKRMAAQGLCEVGAHLHPWVNPPHDEQVNELNSYPGNLSYDLEYNKLKALTALISERIGVRPVAYKAGRYGLGANTYRILSELGYAIDASVMSNVDMRQEIGLDFRMFPDQPYWAGADGQILEVPLTRGIMGPLGRRAPGLFHSANRPGGKRWKLPGLLARMGLAEEGKLTPEGVSLDEQKRFTRALLDRGQRVFCYTYHSSSLVAGGTPYVPDESALTEFMASLEGYFAFFMTELGGRSLTLSELHALASAPKD